jgi:hypothetical protein
MMEQSDQMALGPDSVSVRHLICCCTLFNGRLTRFILFSVWVSQGSTLVFKTTLTVERGAKAAAEAGNNDIGMAAIMWDGKNVSTESKKRKRREE